MKYNYFESVKDDVKRGLEDYLPYYEGIEDLDDLKERLNDDMWADDSITGNGSGSYTFSTYQAEENLSHNLDLIEEVAEAYGIEPTISAGWEHGAEWWDVSIRCYYLPQAIEEVISENEEEIVEKLGIIAID